LFVVIVFPVVAFSHSAMDRFLGEVPVDMQLSGDVLVVRTLVVPEGVTLTISPGTVVRFEKSADGGNRIAVEGRLVAVGTREKPIRFIPKDKGSGPWYGVEFRAGGRGRMEHCVLEGASAGVKDPGGRAALRETYFK
jgi:hypothetical protein